MTQTDSNGTKHDGRIERNDSERMDSTPMTQTDSNGTKHDGRKISCTLLYTRDVLFMLRDFSHHDQIMQEQIMHEIDEEHIKALQDSLANNEQQETYDHDALQM
jgi:hypothetical protein